MSQKFALKFETDSDERRDIFIASMIAVLNNVITGGDKATLVFTDERPTYRGKENRTITTNWEDGQEPPTLWEIGIRTTQHDLFSAYTGQTTTCTSDGSAIAPTTVVEDGAGEDAGQDPEQLNEQPVGLIPTPDDEPEDNPDRPSASYDPSAANDKDLDPFRRYFEEQDSADTDKTDDTGEQQQEG